MRDESTALQINVLQSRDKRGYLWGCRGRRVERGRNVALDRRVATQNHGRKVGPEKVDNVFFKLSQTSWLVSWVDAKLSFLF